jgi:hypothetical protein
LQGFNIIELIPKSWHECYIALHHIGGRASSKWVKTDNKSFFFDKIYPSGMLA